MQVLRISVHDTGSPVISGVSVWMSQNGLNLGRISDPRTKRQTFRSVERAREVALDAAKRSAAAGTTIRVEEWNGSEWAEVAA